MERFVKEYLNYRIREMKQSEMSDTEFRHKSDKYRNAVAAYEVGTISNRECMRILCGAYDQDFLNRVAAW